VTGWAIQVVAATTSGETGTATTYIWPDILLATCNLPSSSTHQSAGYHTQLYGGRICYSHTYIAAGNLLLYLNFSDKPLLSKIQTNLKALSPRHPTTILSKSGLLQKHVYDGEEKCIQHLIQKTWGTRPLGGNKSK
jgi:hypothetical protein